MKPIPHGTRTGYRKHNCRCIECLRYQRALAKRHRDRMAAAHKCRDCTELLSADDINDGHIRCGTCRDIRNRNQREAYKPLALAKWAKPLYKPAHRQVEPAKAKTPSSWWMAPACQTDRAAFNAVVAERLPEMLATGLTYRASWMEL